MYAPFVRQQAAVTEVGKTQASLGMTSVAMYSLMGASVRVALIGVNIAGMTTVSRVLLLMMIQEEEVTQVVVMVLVLASPPPLLLTRRRLT